MKTINQWATVARTFLASPYPLAFLLFLSLVRPPREIAGAALDPSWQQAYGYFLTHHLQFGRDVVFTYGPLGYFSTEAYEPQLFLARYIWETVGKGVFAFLVAFYLRRASPHVTRPLLIGMAILASGVFLYDAIFMLLIILPALYLLLAERVRLPLLISICLLYAFVSLVKIPFLVLAGIALVLAEVRLRIVSASWFYAPLGYWLLGMMGFWLVVGQSLGNIPAYIRSSIEITQGYNVAMMWPDPRPGSGFDVAICALIALGLIALLIRMAWHPTARSVPRSSRWTTVIFLTATLLMNWRSGTVRQDSGHLWHFAGIVLLVSLSLSVWLIKCSSAQPTPQLNDPSEDQSASPVPFVPSTSHPQVPIRVPTGVIAGIALCLFATEYVMVHSPLYDPMLSNYVMIRFAFLRDGIVYVAAPRQWQQRMAVLRQERLREWGLPRLTARIGSGTVDEMTHHQGLVLLQQPQLLYHPRPVFQSYAAYTPLLSRMNADFLRGADAPQFMLLHRDTIDERYPNLDDGLALREIWRRYYPMDAERDFLLLQRATTPSAEPIPEPTLRRTATWGEVVRLPNNSRIRHLFMVRFHIRYRKLGKIRTALYRLPSPQIVVRRRNHKELTCNLLPAMAEAGFPLSPQPITSEEMLRLYTQPTDQSEIQSFTVVLQPGTVPYYDNHYEVEIQPITGYVNRTLSRAEYARISVHLRPPKKSVQ